MDRSLRAGVSPPQPGHVRAGIAGDEPMVMLLRRLMRLGFILTLFVVLASGGSSFEPQKAIARPYFTGGPDGTPNGNGDPTGDDVPSPTPKPTALRAARPGAAVSAVQTRASRWSLVVSILIRLGIR